MPKFIIRTGTFNIKLLIPFLLALAQVIIFIIDLYYPEEKSSFTMNSYSTGLGQIAIIILPYIKCFSISSQKKEKRCKCSKKNCLHYFILFFLSSIDIVTTNLCTMKIENINDKTLSIIPISDFFSTKDGIEIILITIFNILLIKYEYFIHHYLSIILFLLFSVSIDLILNNYSSLSNMNALDIFFNILSIFSKISYLCFIKYMIDKHYHYYWNIELFLGILLLVSNIMSLLIFLISPKDTDNIFAINFYDYFNVVPKGIIISKFIIYFIIQFIYNISFLRHFTNFNNILFIS